MSRATFADLLKAQEARKQKNAENSQKNEGVSGLVQSFRNPSKPIQAKPSEAGTDATDNKTVNFDTTQVSPAKDFQKVPNSIIRDALPQKIFIGTSKHTYDVLYQRTRGAVQPTRTIRATKRELMKWAGISDVTLFKHLTHLKSVGLIKIEHRLGSHDGSIYEVLIPEEIGLNLTESDMLEPIQTHPIPSNPNPSKKLGWDPSKFLGLHWMGNPIENKGTYENPKTFFKDFKYIDDEAFAAMLDILRRGSEKVSGKIPDKSQSENWRELAELLVMELEVAAARTKSVSNVPAFLTEHLRRRLAGKREAPKPKTGNSSKMGKTDPEAGQNVPGYKPEPLTEQGRETVLKTLQDYVDKGQKEFVLTMEDTFTSEDWNFLKQRLIFEPIGKKKAKAK
jgi:hypothetical protein